MSFSSLAFLGDSSTPWPTCGKWLNRDRTAGDSGQAGVSRHRVAGRAVARVPGCYQGTAVGADLGAQTLAM